MSTAEVIAFRSPKKERTFEEDSAVILKTFSCINADYSYQLFYRLGTMDDVNANLELSKWTIAINKMIDDILVSMELTNAKQRILIVDVAKALEDIALGQCASITITCRLSPHVVNTYSFEAFKVANGVIAIRDLIRNSNRVIVRG